MYNDCNHYSGHLHTNVKHLLQRWMWDFISWSETRQMMLEPIQLSWGQRQGTACTGLTQSNRPPVILGFTATGNLLLWKQKLATINKSASTKHTIIKTNSHMRLLILWCVIWLQEYPRSPMAGWGWGAVSWLSQLSVAGNANRWVWPVFWLCTETVFMTELLCFHFIHFPCVGIIKKWYNKSMQESHRGKSFTLQMCGRVQTQCSHFNQMEKLNEFFLIFAWILVSSHFLDGQLQNVLNHQHDSVV